ncbi:hypothetical protein [Rhodoplanes serenus]|nr:hypothetical protein [Rhodoplanes serenus]
MAGWPYVTSGPASDPSAQPAPGDADEIGDPPGSPAYFGTAAMASMAAGAPPTSNWPAPAVGSPPGSAAYYGTAVAVAAASAASARPDDDVGDPPGSPAYLGTVGPSPAEPSAQRPGEADGPPVAVGDPPGSPAHFGNAAL